MMNSKKSLFILSLLVTIGFALIPGIGIRNEEGNHIFGFPADLLGYYGDGAFSFMYLGLAFNLVFFYFLFVILNNLWVKIARRSS
ncbi:hypothetical protein [Sutcliffiella halmapala]|uniref:hypothetical protein n=1 Tax=Sutcliffiella halmapala TaxID=79882 RepID=UPI000994DEBA|nr:hypothetical protein [Sutcliffiella halmapala]